MFVKVCGLSTADSVQAAVDAGWVFRGMTSLPVTWDK